ncbi:MAG: radical SAM protein, partial [bacterium]
MIRFTRLLTDSFQEVLPSKIAVWNLTRKCNLSCKHCYIDAGENKKDELSKDEAFNVIDELASLDFKVLLFSGGEPLFYEYLFELNAYAKTYRMKTCLSSNGSLITDDIAIKIKDGGFEYIGISIDGIKETHDRFRGISGSFDKALQGLRILKKQGVKSGIRFTLNK